MQGLVTNCTISAWKENNWVWQKKQGPWWNGYVAKWTLSFCQQFNKIMPQRVTPTSSREVTQQSNDPLENWFLELRNFNHRHHRSSVSFHEASQPSWSRSELHCSLQTQGSCCRAKWCINHCMLCHGGLQKCALWLITAPTLAKMGWKLCLLLDIEGSLWQISSCTKHCLGVCSVTYLIEVFCSHVWRPTSL